MSRDLIKPKYSRYFVAMPSRLLSQTGVWRCDKCFEDFSSYKKLRMHKRDLHSY